jgi:hypothetical protein
MSFQNYLTEIHTLELVSKLIIQGISAWMTPNPDLETDTADTDNLAYLSQDNIGWNMIPRGFLSIHWAALQEQSIGDQTKIIMGDAWSAKVSKWWITKSHEIWNIRNNDIHNELINGTLRCEEETFAQLRKLYDKEAELSAYDQCIFHVPLENRIKLPWRSLAAWIDVTKPVVDRLIEQFQARLFQGQTDIRQYGIPTNLNLQDQTTQLQVTNPQQHSEENTQRPNFIQTDIRSFFTTSSSADHVSDDSQTLLSNYSLGSNSSSRRLRQSISDSE